MSAPSVRALANTAVQRQRRRSGWRQWAVVGAFTVAAVLAITLGRQATSAHRVDTVAHTAKGPQPVSVTANPTGSANLIAWVGIGIGSVSALAAVGSVAVSAVALKRPSRE